MDRVVTCAAAIFADVSCESKWLLDILEILELDGADGEASTAIVVRRHRTTMEHAPLHNFQTISRASMVGE